MGFKKIVITGPYIDELNERFRAFYTNSGFKVLKVNGLGIEDLYEMGSTKPSQAYKAALEAFVPKADGIFVGCTNFRCSDVIEQIEQDTGKPVVTANQATAWHLMSTLGIGEPIEGYGELLRRPRLKGIFLCRTAGRKGLTEPARDPWGETRESENMKRLALIHTVIFSAEMFKKKLAVRYPGLQSFHVVDESLIQELMKSGGVLTPGLVRRLATQAGLARDAGARGDPFYLFLDLSGG